MTGRIIIMQDQCGYMWEIRLTNVNELVQGLCVFKTPEKAVRSACHSADRHGIVVLEDIEQRCK